MFFSSENPGLDGTIVHSFDAYVQDKDIDKRFNMTFLKRKNNCAQIRKFIWKEKSLKSLF